MLSNSEESFIEFLVTRELKTYNLSKLFTKEQKENIRMTCRKNVYSYDMNDDYAVRDAVGTEILNAEMKIPDNYKDRFWVA